MTLEELRDDFGFLSSWEERYEYIIDLGRDLGDFPDTEKNETNRVKGCMSQVWIVPSWEGSGTDARLRIAAASDSSIVSGLAAVMKLLYEGKTVEEAASVDAAALFQELELAEHLSPSRRNGLAALEKRIQAFIAA